MDMYTELVCYRFELTRILLNKKNISKETFIKVKKALLDIEEMRYKLKNETNFDCVRQADEIKQFILSTKKVGR